ncbi:MAG: alpha/beta hydrolase [Acidimicrobiia bacterium]
MTEIPATAPAEVVAFNAMIEETTRDLPKIWDVGPVVARAARDEGASVFGPLVLSDRARQIDIDGPGGSLPVRVFEPAEPRGVLLHMHGGGWVLGAANHHDPMLERLADATGLVVASVDYRLAPEHPYPAGPDDCEAAALWLVENGPAELGGPLLAIGGESAGAHLSAVTMIRLRDRHGLAPFRAALLTYGCFDLRGTPSLAAFGDRPLILNTSVTRWFVEQFVGGEDLEQADISPLFADLSGLPPALFTVGDADPLLDDSLFMAARWRAADNDADLDIWPGGIHAFDYFETDYGLAARAGMAEFLNLVLS